MDTERERERGEHWEEPTTLDLDLIGFWAIVIRIKEKIKDYVYEITSIYQ